MESVPLSGGPLEVPQPVLAWLPPLEVRLAWLQELLVVVLGQRPLAWG